MKFMNQFKGEEIKMTVKLIQFEKPEEYDLIKNYLLEKYKDEEYLVSHVNNSRAYFGLKEYEVSANREEKRVILFEFKKGGEKINNLEKELKGILGKNELSDKTREDFQKVLGETIKN